ncbi:hypothetical protein [Streptomyces sp. MUSC 14]|uniref:hypothetical protein n=1 Tax=Streptomyces sp. MUSC 14 TaxID=1354889 RepID=UPI000A820DD4|nr:hypothetical protein [Streptomyces sp. MUSC 14]
MTELVLGYWCECWTEDLSSGQPPALRAAFDAYSAPQADRWVAVTLRTISPALDSDASDVAWAWLSQGRIATRRALLNFEPCSVTVTQDHTRVTWTIRPVFFVPLAHRQGTELPACAHDFKPHAAD